MHRIEQLRQVALQHRHSHEEFYYHFYKKYCASQEPSAYLKYAEAFSFAFSKLTPNITDGELIVGEVFNYLSPEEKTEWWRKWRDDLS